jgi:RNA polymerase sigma factor (TIGR02999 family)
MGVEMNMSPAPQIAELPNAAFESLYAALRVQARHYLRREQYAQSLSPTILVHEAWMALARSRSGAPLDRSHYFRLVSHVMKNLLVDYARRRWTTTRGGGALHVELQDASAAVRGDCETVLAVAEAMGQLASADPALAALVEMRYFGGFSEAEVAQILGVSVRTVRRKWLIARLRLLESLQSLRSGSSAYD